MLSFIIYKFRFLSYFFLIQAFSKVCIPFFTTYFSFLQVPHGDEGTSIRRGGSLRKHSSGLKRGGSLRKLHNRLTGNSNQHFTNLEDTSTSPRSISLPPSNFFHGSVDLEQDNFAKERKRSSLLRNIARRWGRIFRRKRQYDVAPSDETHVNGEIPCTNGTETKEDEENRPLYIGENHEVRKKITFASESKA